MTTILPGILMAIIIISHGEAANAPTMRRMWIGFAVFIVSAWAMVAILINAVLPTAWRFLP